MKGQPMRNGPRCQMPGFSFYGLASVLLFCACEVSLPASQPGNNSPIDSLEPLAKAGVPLLHVFAHADTALPWMENTGIVADRYPKLGGSIMLIRKVGFDHHPHGLEQDPTPVVNFVLTNALRANGLSP
jgi:hypothetical protein